MERKKYERLSLEERIIIETLLKEKRKKTYIAIQLNRSRSTITREINNWVRRPSDCYSASLAHWYAKDDNDTKRLQDKITQNPKLKMAIFRGLLSHCSPELISGRLKLAYPDEPSMQISYESIYRYIYTHPQGKINLKLIQLLVRHKSRRRNVKLRGKRQSISDRKTIDSRPVHIENRQEPGHWEGDLMIGTKQNSCIGTLVERKTRYVILVKLSGKKSDVVTTAFAKKFKRLPLKMRKTMTYDNGTEMANHKSFTLKTGMDVFFAHPYSSWERGTNENTNGLIRRFLDKKTDFNNISNDELEKLQNILNNRPRKVLSYYTAAEMFFFEKQILSKDMVTEGIKMGNKSSKDLFSFLSPALKKI
jgi:transposase, IS30 family